MDHNSAAAVYILVFFLLGSGVIVWLLFEVARSQFRRKDTLRKAEELRLVIERASKESAEKATQEREASLAEEALRILNSPDREKRAQERNKKEEKEQLVRTMEGKVAAERAKLQNELAFESIEQPVKTFVSASKPRTICLPERTITLQPGSYEVHFLIEGDVNQDSKSVTGLSCPLAQTTWQFADENGIVWEIISDLGGEFFSQFPLGITLAEMKRNGVLPRTQDVLREPTQGSFSPNYEFWVDATKSTCEAFRGRGILRGLCSGSPAPIPEATFKVWKMTMPLAPKASWVCHDLAWNPEMNDILVRDYGWMSSLNKPLPIFFYHLPLNELCPLTWYFSSDDYKGEYYRDLVLTKTGKKTTPQPEIRVV